MAPQIRIADMHYNKYTIYEAKVNNKIVYKMSGFAFSLISLGIISIIPSRRDTRLSLCKVRR